MDQLSIPPLAVAIVASLVAAATDWRRFKIYNALTLPLFASGLAHHAIAGGAGGLAASGSGALAGLVLLLPLYVMGGMGAGDVKLTAGLGAWLQFTATCELVLVSCLLTIGCSLAIMLYVRKRAPAFSTESEEAAGARLEELARRPDRRYRLVPFGVMAAAALCGLALWRHWIA